MVIIDFYDFIKFSNSSITNPKYPYFPHSAGLMDLGGLDPLPGLWYDCEVLASNTAKVFIPRRCSVKVLKGLLAVCVAVLALVSPSLAQEESKMVTGEGVAVIHNGQKDIARDAAIQDAQQRAVEQAIGVLIDSQTQVENYQVISDKIMSQTKGYIKRYNITNEVDEGNLLRVFINAEVSLGKLSDDLSAIGILLGRMHKPRTIILIAEQNIGQEYYAWWWGDIHARQSDMAVTESVLMDKFIEKGFEMIDQDVASKKLSVSNPYKGIQSLSPDQAKTIGGQVDAEVVLIGKAFAKLNSSIGALKSAQATVSIKAVRTDTGQVIASVMTNAPAVHNSDLTAGNEALKKAAKDAAEQLTTKILAMYAKETGGTRSVNLTVNGLNKTQFVKFKDVLRNQVRNVKDIHERSYQNGVAKVSVDYKGSAQILSDELSAKSFGDFGVEVTGSTANSLELKITPKQ